jgi:hypothetical protein
LYTITVDGKCYWPHAVNYLLFGLIWRLCSSHPTTWGPPHFRDPIAGDPAGVSSIDLSKMLDTISTYLVTQTDDSREVKDCKISWATSGFLGWPHHSVSPPSCLPGCDPCSCSPSKDPLRLTWTWKFMRGDFNRRRMFK